MARKLKTMGILALVVLVVWTGGLIGDRQKLRQDILRLHVVAASDDPEDQAVKLRVRDAVLETLRQGLRDLTDPEKARAYVREMLPKLEEAAQSVLREAGFDDDVTVSLTEEAFPVREYDSFSLPSGVYNALRVVIGEGEGKNWWCVVFPELCTGATGEEFRQVSGFSDILDDTLTGQYEIRFWVLDALGRLENFLHRTSDGN
jgi:stage II sporulation protein R